MKNGCINILPIENASGDVVGIVVLFTNEALPFNSDYEDFILMIKREITRDYKTVCQFENERNHRLALIELDQSKSAFFSHVGHELKAPLSLILGPLEATLSETNLPPSLRPTLEIAFRNAVRVLKMIDNLLNQENLSILDIEPIFRPTNLSGRTLHLASAFDEIIDKARLEYRVSVDPDLGCRDCFVDIVVWEKVMFGLLGQAVKHTLKGFISCELVKRVDESVFQLVVMDSGVYSRSSGESMELQQIRRLVKLHYGSMVVEQRSGGGTKVVVTIPLGCGHIPADRVLDIQYELEPENLMDRGNAGVMKGTDNSSVDASPPTGFESSASFAILEMQGKKTQQVDEEHSVFVVDGNLDTLSHLQHVLGQRWRTRTFSNGQDALAAVVKGGGDVPLPSLVLADIMIPSVNGFQLLQAIKQNPVTKDVPVILMSNKTTADLRISMAQARADDFMAKPFSNKELVARIQTQLELSDLRLRLFQELQEKTSLTEFQMNMTNDIVEQSPSGIYQCTMTEVKFCNQKMAEMYGYNDPAKFVQDHQKKVFSIYDRIFPEYHDGLNTNFRSAVAGRLRPTPIMEFKFQAPTGVIWVECSSIIRYDVNGVFKDLIGTFTDITVRKLYEEEKVAQLKAEKSRADEAELMRKQQEDFIDMVIADDVLRVSKLKLSYLLMSPPTSNQIYTISMNLIVVDIATEYNPTKLLEQICGSFFIELRCKQITLTLSVSESLRDATGQFLGDPSRLSQILINLISNAIKFTSCRETRKITVQAQMELLGTPSEVELNCSLEFSVTDTGQGMTLEEREKLFQRFSQMSKTNEYGGSGLGLYISKNLVELMGGTVRVVSTKGVGTTFTFNVHQKYHDKPMLKRKLPESKSNLMDEVPTKQRTGPKNGKFKFLVVDDNQINRKVLERHLNQYNVITATNGQEALNYFQIETFDLVLMDIEMPVMNGLDATRNIREFEISRGKRRTPIIAVTGNAREDQINGTIACGLDNGEVDVF
ncbi:UNVERIFIED_CONTAM: hypothetical protein HDU68_005991 [Siphonaria sp. JEL0065]|nr:hypothetical protein HDU68_005991 [Siphonaria sp. JEL0065]